MQCPQCHAENREQRRFCAECGAPLNFACPSCGFSNEPGEKFCGGCGIQIPEPASVPESQFSSPNLYTPKHLADKILQSKSALEGERKQVTALFCDIANSTALANRLGPEEMHTLLNQFFELAYMFKHALTQDVAYNSLLEKRRRELHRVIGRAMEELYADRLPEYFEIIAYHYGKGEIWNKALDFNLKAAKKAKQSFANREALTYYNQALEIAEKESSAVDISTLMSIYEARSNLYLVLNEFQRSIGESEKLLAVARQENDPVNESKALTAMGYASLWDHDFDQANHYAREAIKVAEKMGEKSVLAGGHFILGEVQGLIGQLDKAKEKVEKSLHISQSAGDLMYESLSLGLLGLFKNWKGEYTEASGLLDEDYKIAKDNSLLAPLFDILFAYGIALTGKGEYDRAIDIFQEGLALTKKVGDEIFHLRVMNSLGWLYLERGDPEIVANAEPQKATISYQAARRVIERVKGGLQSQDLRTALDSNRLIKEVYEMSSSTPSS